MHSNINQPSNRFLVVLAGGVLLVVMINGFIALFGLYYSNLLHQQDMQRIDQLAVSLAEAGNAEVHFKRQVQEWKNMLLRGDEAEDFEHYHAAFIKEQAQVRKQLRSLIENNSQVDVERLRRMLDEHAGLEERYTAALAESSLDDMADARRVDALVRGIDRNLDRDLTKLTQEFNVQLDTMQSDFRERDQERYATLRTLVTVTGTVNVVLVLLLLYQVLRRQRQI